MIAAVLTLSLTCKGFWWYHCRAILLVYVLFICIVLKKFTSLPQSNPAIYARYGLQAPDWLIFTTNTNIGGVHSADGGFWYGKFLSRGELINKRLDFSRHDRALGENRHMHRKIVVVYPPGFYVLVANTAAEWLTIIIIQHN